MNLITVQNLSKSFGTRVLFENITFNIDESSHIGLIGANGVGKTTLFGLLQGRGDCEGKIIKSNLLKIGLVEQIPQYDEDTLVYDYTLSAFSSLLDAEKKLHDLQKELEKSSSDALIAQFDKTLLTFTDNGGEVFRSKTRSMLLGLGLLENELQLPLGVLSGGQKTRVMLAKALLSDANLLLLDEPTNHLDIAATTFLEGVLRDVKKAFVVISHDRYFLDKVTNRTIEIENETLREYKGGYTEFVQKKRADLEAEMHKYENTVAEIERIEGIIAQQRQWNKERSIRTAEHKQKSIDRLEANLVKPQLPQEALKFKFKAASGGGNEVLAVSGVSKEFDGKALFENASFDIRKGQRVFLIGQNGCGKTTLLNIILGKEQSSGGSVRFGSDIHCASYDQTQSNISGTKDILHEVWDVYPRLSQTEVRNALAMFHFKGDDVFKSTGVLSGGERARLALLLLLMRGANLLLLDEPTNHLDISSRESLEDALADYNGTLFIISHDRYLINKLATKLLVMENGTLNVYDSSYDEYAEKASELSREKQTEKKKNVDYKREKELTREKNLREGKARRAEEEVTRIEDEIKSLTAQLEECGSDFEKAVELSGRIEAMHTALDEAIALWEEYV